jgi:glycogen debranching enzyme
MRQTEVTAVTALVNGLLRSNLCTGRDGRTGAEYRYLCPSPGEYPWQWLWDSCFHAVATAHVDPEHAAAELVTLASTQREDGFIPHITYWGTRLWGFSQPLAYLQAPPGQTLRHSGLMQPPVFAQAVERVAEIARDASVITSLLGVLDAHHNWLATNRAPDEDGLLVIVSPYESGMDQSPAYDGALGLRGKPGRWTLGLRDRWLDLRNWLDSYESAKMLRRGSFRVKDPLVNACYADSLETMARLHRRAGNGAVAAAYAQLAAKVTGSLVDKLYDRSRGAFFALLGAEERRSAPRTVAGLAPLTVSGLPDEVAGELVERSLTDRDGFWMAYPVPSVAADEPAFDPRGSAVIWRGPTWVNTNWLLWRGLHRHGFDDLATQLASRTLSMVAGAGLREFYNPLNGQGMGARSFGWSALALDMAAR